jgi:hypothetical protein
MMAIPKISIFVGVSQLKRKSENENKARMVLVSLESDVEHQTHVRDIGRGEILEHRDQIQEFVVVRVGKPAADGHGMLRVEDVGCGRVVDDDGVFEVSADLGEIFDVVALVVVATLSEEPVMNDLVDVELIE